MGKNARKPEVRGAATSSTVKQKFISKKKSKKQAEAVKATVTKGLEGVSIFDQINDSN